MLLLLCFTVSHNKLPYFGNIGENGRFIRAISGRWCTPALSKQGENACAISGRWCTPALSKQGENACAISGRWCTAVSPGINSRAFGSNFCPGSAGCLRTVFHTKPQNRAIFFKIIEATDVRVHIEGRSILETILCCFSHHAKSFPYCSKCLFFRVETLKRRAETCRE